LLLYCLDQCVKIYFDAVLLLLLLLLHVVVDDDDDHDDDDDDDDDENDKYCYLGSLLINLYCTEPVLKIMDAGYCLYVHIFMKKH